MALFEVTDYDRKIWNEELKDFLPDKIIDVHTHVYLRKFITAASGSEPTRNLVTWTSTVAKENPIEDLQETYRLMFPGKDVKALMFISGRTGNKENNAYLSDVSRRTGWPALYYSHPDQSARELEKNIPQGGFLGLKC